MTHKWLRKIYVESKNRCVLRSKKPWSDPSPRAPAPRTGATHVDPLTQMPDISLGFPTPRLGDHHQRVPYIPSRWNIIPSRWFGWLEDDHFPYTKYGVMAVGDGCMWSSRENLPGCTWMFCWVCGWINGDRINSLFHLLINGVYWGYNPLTFY